MSSVSESEKEATRGLGPPVRETTQVVASLSLAREKQLLDRARKGDRDALRELLATYADVLYSRVILPRVGDVAVAEDILKATMVTAIEKLERFRWEGRSIYFWMRQISANKVIDHHRRNQRGARLEKALKREGELLAVSPTAIPSPEKAVLEKEEQSLNRERISNALAKINARYRHVIELRLIKELPREQCAKQLDVSLGTFDVIFYRAVRAFRREFGERDA
jgi:RNA polymerase sigma-70 factor (ECF subfamily)